MNGYLSLGSNIGDRMYQLRSALAGLDQHNIFIARCSDVYETRAVEVYDRQKPYLNMAVQIFSPFDPYDLLEVCRKVETSLGRERPYPHAPRTIDIDILLLEGVVLMSEVLTVPHPRLEHRAFVIHPLAQIAPEMILPSGRPIAVVKKAMGDDEIMEVCKMHR